MKLISALLLLVIAHAGCASDWGCTSQGGTCLDYRYYFCTAGYETGLCDGDSNQRCCLNCGSTCLSDEGNWQSCCDSSCSGKCQDNSNYCSGTYSSGKCGGPSDRQCCSSSGGTGGGGTNCYGNIMDVDTTGASRTTASQDNLLYGGVSASQSMAANDLSAMAQWKDWVEEAGSKLCVQPSVIAGIISRETRAGKVLNSNGYGSDGHGYGLMQVDDRYHSLEGGPFSYENIQQGTQILIDMINGVASKHRDWTQDMSLKGGICAYNSGVSNVDTYDNMDVGTTGNDYSNDVTARAQYYYDHGY